MVHVFIANIKDLPDALENPAMMEGLPDERKDKIARIRRVHERKQSLGAGMLLKHVQRLLGDTLCYNLSHSGDYVMCAVSDKKVGCDIEKIKEAPIKVATRFFCQGEVDYLSKVTETDYEFFRIWTIKESYMKMDGRGLSMGLKNFEVVFDEGCEKPAIMKDGKLVDCYIKEYELDGYKISVCSEENVHNKDLIFVELI